ncbi:PorT family protein [Chitinophaga sp. Mgbs1]|uniref:PorT family protein n=1 Tax=Chitinophaga solisilvae TaxID=1233460 RepID=A0A433WG74_9BACT|nr:PorT family protein [Chitinophaga solisilvae]
MKFFTFTCVVAFMAVTTANAQVSLGLRGGYVNSWTDFKQSGNGSNRVNTNSLDGWQAGFYLNVPLLKNLHLQPGLSYITKGTKLETTAGQPSNIFVPGATAIKLKYLELPVNLVYKVPIGIGKLVIGAGPYAAYCVRGDYDLAIYSDGKEVQNSSQRVDFKKDPNVFTTSFRLQRWDAGLNATAGIEFNCYVTVGVNYSLGMMDIDRANAALKNRYFGINIGVLLNREDW